jgi:mono/diheme cytochrome c family protein
MLMTWRRVLRIAGGIVGLVSLAIGGIAAYASATWDSARYADWPLPDLHASTDSATVARGRYLVTTAAHCVDCHTPSGAPLLSGGVAFTLPLGTMFAPNITPDSATGIGRYSDGQIARMLRYGVRPHGRAAMPFMQFELLSDDDVVAVLSYLRAMPPVSHPVPNHRLNVLAKVIMTFLIKPNPRDNKAPKTAPPSAPSVERGEYLVNTVAECAGCHTLRDLRTGAVTGPHLGGGFDYPADADPSLIFTPPNLTSDPTGKTGQLTEDQFVARFRQGRIIKESIMPWGPFSAMHEDDIRAIYRYIRTVPPVRNEVVTMRRKN